MALSPDGTRWAAALEPKDGEEDAYILLVNGKEFARRTGLARQITFSPDGSRVAWVEKKDKLWRVLVDGEESSEYRDIFRDDPLQFSPEGRHVVYLPRTRTKGCPLLFFKDRSRGMTLYFLWPALLRRA
ncbi:MAG: hypothetical protein U5L00_18865 [Desulfovermiculus sp.]|nr:hypothetical protein [Desulfovermiculus sp.]